MDLDSEPEYLYMKKNIKDFLRTRLKAVLFDADGVLFDGQEWRGVDPETGRTVIMKSRHFVDGQGISFLRAIGLRIAFISGESGGPLLSTVEKWNRLPSVKKRAWGKIDIISKKLGVDKVDAIAVWLMKSGYDWSECAYIGDDVNDRQAMQKVRSAGGLVIVPANATRRIITLGNIILAHAGGHGAIREFTEMVLDARGIDELELPVA